MLTPSSKKAQSLLANNLPVADLKEFMSLEVLMGTVENTNHPGGLRGESSTCENLEWSDELLALWRMIVERIDRHSSGSVFTGATVVESLNEINRRDSTSDFVTLALRNRVITMESTVGVVNKDSDLSLTLWDNVARMLVSNDRSAVKQMEEDIEPILGDILS